MAGPCESCKHLRQETDDDYGSNMYYGCDLKESNGNLRSFPFKKDMPCHELAFWAVPGFDPDL